jgi:hypothetical protein
LIYGTNLLQQLGARYERHRKIKDDQVQIRTLPLKKCQAVGSIHPFYYLVTVALQGVGQAASDRLFIIHNQDGLRPAQALRLLFFFCRHRMG